MGGRGTNTFTVKQSGQLSVTLTATTPASSIVMGLGVGIPADGICGILPGGSTTAVAGASPQLSGVASPGMLCVAVYDVGNQAAPVSYTVTVSHP